MDDQDVRMVERRSRPRFRAEAPQSLRIAGNTRRQQLQRHRTIEFAFVSPVDLAHAAETDEGLDFIAADHLPREVAVWPRFTGESRRRFQRRFRLLVRGQKELHLPTQCLVAATSGRDVRRTETRGHLHRALEHFLHARPFVRTQGHGRFDERRIRTAPILVQISARVVSIAGVRRRKVRE